MLFIFYKTEGSFSLCSEWIIIVCILTYIDKIDIEFKFHIEYPDDLLHCQSKFWVRKSSLFLCFVRKISLFIKNTAKNWNFVKYDYN